MATTAKKSTTRKPATAAEIRARSQQPGPDRMSAPAEPGFLKAPVLVHAYRRTANLDKDGKEVAVEVVAYGERVKFQANARGHVVGEVTTQAMLDRLTKEIPEAYIVYSGEDVKAAERTEPQSGRPDGKFVLKNGDEYAVLDNMTDAALRKFAKTAGIESEALPEVLKGETLAQAIYNTLNTGD